MGFIIAILCVFFPVANIAPFVIVLMGLIMGLFLCSEKNDNFLAKLFLLAFITRIIGATVLYHVVFLSNRTGLLFDSWSYSENGYRILNLWLGGLRDFDAIVEQMGIMTTSGNLGNYDFWNAIVYFFTGKSPLCVVFINCLLGSFTVIIIYYITRFICDKKIAKLASILVAFWPSTFFWSIQNLKDPMILFLATLLIWAVLHIKVRFRLSFLIILILSTILLKQMRFFLFALFYVVILPLSLLFPVWKRRKLEITVLALLLAVGAFFYIDSMKIIFMDNLLGAEQNQSFLSWAYKMRTYRTLDASSAFLTNIDFSDPLKMGFFMPAALLVIWFAPFPWQVGSALQIIALPEMLIYYMLIPSMIFGIKFVVRNKLSKGGLIIAYIIVITFVLAFIEGNVGTLFRHRSMMLPFYLIFIAIGLNRHEFKVTYRENKS